MSDTVDRPRTAAATEAVRRSKAKRDAVSLAARLPLLDDATLAQLTELLLLTCMVRGVELREVEAP